MNDWSKDINLETIKEYLQECAENDDYHYEQYQVDIVMHEYIRQKQVIETLINENERLNNIIKEQGLEDKPNYYVKGLEGCLKEYQEEVYRLNNIIDKKEQFLGDNIKRLEREVVKRDNIINELERILQQDLENEKDTYWTNITKEDYIQFMLNKLQELKGSDKE